MARGRQPANVTTFPIGVLPGSGRPEPDPDIPKEEAALWREFVGKMPADWFRTSTHLLRPLCCHIVTLRTVSAALAKARSKDDWLLVRRLTPIFDRETRAAAHLSSVLRLTPRSRTTTEIAANAKARLVPTEKPWSRT
jgi:hypothetical protein